MNGQVGFIGCGKMAQAMIQGMLTSGILSPEQIIVSARTEETLISVKDQFHIKTSTNNEMVARDADYLFLAVKPDLYTEVINEVKNVMKEDAIVITIAAGISLDFIEKTFGRRVKVVRSMPNTPSLVGEGMSALCASNSVHSDEMIDVIRLFESFGKAEVIEEKLMDAIPAISGSSPAYVYMFIEAMADGAVIQGIPREKAYKLAAQAVLGAAKMVLETGLHPGELKDNVCTPGGATIQAVAELEKHGFRSSVISAMERCTKKSVELSKG
ncbi:pyrroline-5-carboxylate reductase [Fredinandcohnia quinoae]|uniref:Pyrroline-5-carboxylate reductase n=1 Tax=Fredinandcohnia quinoae TaxID=2918902 RepID=A0AAW5EEZ2_9BACI|nr:pyrroline-5-carboxylate reductase [Fredinandcohnia sp. SECRCQ15]MCH1627753.1 pyrroline-5-carboxylate reductase [Fredinandcohnia sp. SECRCQ15]